MIWWWREFLDDPSTISVMTKQNLENVFASSENMMLKLEKMKTDVLKNFRKKCYDYCKIISEYQHQIYGLDVLGCSDLYKQLTFSYNDLAWTRSKIIEEFITSSEILNFYMRDSKKTKKINKAMADFEDLSLEILRYASTCDNYEDRFNAVLASQVLIGKNQLFCARLRSLSDYVHHRSNDISLMASILTSKALKMIDLVRGTHEVCDNLVDVFGSIPSAGIEEKLKSDIQTMGDTRKNLNEQIKIVEELETQKNILEDFHDESSFRTSMSLLLNNVQESEKIRNKLVEMQMLAYKLEEENRILQNKIRAEIDNKSYNANRIEEIERNTETIKYAINQLKVKPVKIDRNEYSTEDITFLLECCKCPPNEFDLEKLRTLVSENEKVLHNIMNNKKILDRAAEKYQEQILDMEKTISAAKAARDYSEHDNI